MRTKLFSNLLIETRERLEFSKDEMAFVLEVNEEMYGRYEAGVWDKSKGHGVEKIKYKIDNLDLQIKKKLVLLEIALRKQQTHNVKKTVKLSSSNGHNLKEKAIKK